MSLDKISVTKEYPISTPITFQVEQNIPNTIIRKNILKTKETEKIKKEEIINLNREK